MKYQSKNIWSKDKETVNEKLKIAFQLAGAEGINHQIKKHKQYLLQFSNLRPLQICEIIETERLLLA